MSSLRLNVYLKIIGNDIKNNVLLCCIEIRSKGCNYQLFFLLLPKLYWKVLVLATGTFCLITQMFKKFIFEHKKDHNHFRKLIKRVRLIIDYFQFHAWSIRFTFNLKSVSEYNGYLLLSFFLENFKIDIKSSNFFWIAKKI